MYAHPRRQIHKKNIHSSSHISWWYSNTLVLHCVAWLVVQKVTHHHRVRHLNQWGAGCLVHLVLQICKWGSRGATSCGHKVYAPATPMSSTSASSPSCCIEWDNIRDRELCNWWLHCRRRLVGRAALGCECSKLLLHGLLISIELVDRHCYRCWSFCRCSCSELTLTCQCSHLGDDCLYVIIFLFGFVLENSECILHISLHTTCDAWCIQLPRVAFLNKLLEVGPNPVAAWLSIPINKIPCV